MKGKIISMMVVALMLLGGVIVVMSIGLEKAEAFSTSPDTKSTRAASYTLYDVANIYSYADIYIQGAYSGYETSFSLNNGNGVFYGKCVEVDITSTVDKTISITVQLGRKLICHDDDVQDLVVTKEYEFTLYSHQKKTFTLYAMCIDMHYDAPGDGIYYDLGSIATGNLYNVIQQISSTNHQDKAGQSAVWAVTDYATEEDLKAYGASDYDIDRAQALLDDAGVQYTLKKNESTPTNNNGIPGFEYFEMVVAVSIGSILSYKKRRGV